MLPRVILFNAVSIDGRIDHFDADIGAFYGLAARMDADGILAGSDTMLQAANAIPPETAADLNPPDAAPDDRRPLLVLVDSRGRVKTWHYWRQQPYWRVGVSLGSRSTPREHLEYLRARKIDFINAGDRQVDLRRALEEVNARYGLKALRVESGGVLNGALLRAGLVTEIQLLVHPAAVGGAGGKSFLRAAELPDGAKGVSLALRSCEKVGDGLVWLTYDVRP